MVMPPRGDVITPGSYHGHAITSVHVLALDKPGDGLRHEGGLRIGECEPQISLLARAEHAARQTQKIMRGGKPLSDTAGILSGKGMLDIGKEGAGADQPVGEAGTIKGLSEGTRLVMGEGELRALPPVEMRQAEK